MYAEKKVFNEKQKKLYYFNFSEKKVFNEKQKNCIILISQLKNVTIIFLKILYFITKKKSFKFLK